MQRKLTRTTRRPGRSPGAIDQHLAAKLIEARGAASLTQEQVSDAVGISYQQYQKYEKARNRVAASMLVRIAHQLGLPPSYFFEGLELSDGEPMMPPAPVTAEQRALIEDFKAILHPGKRLALRRLIAAEAEETRQQREQDS